MHHPMLLPSEVTWHQGPPLLIQQAGLRSEQVKWRRVVLDEAHSIKDRRCSTARAVFGLTSKYKWALSGTPLQARPAPYNSSHTWT